MKLFVIIIVLLIAVGAVVTTLVILFWPSPPKIPADEDHNDRTTCFECHETGDNDAPKFPSSHEKKIEDGDLTENVEDCLKCHEREG